MSTYGTAAVIDSPESADLLERGARLAADTDADVYLATSPDGWTRLTISWIDIDRRAEVERILGEIRTGRAAVAQDNDEFGAEWTVLAGEQGVVRVVHRRYLLNADPMDSEEVALAIASLETGDPREYDVSGPAAVNAAAELFGVDAGAMRAAEEHADSESLIDGSVGGPFRWWWALELDWPGAGSGSPVRPAHTDRPLRLNRATWPPFAVSHVVPHLADPVDWAVTPFGLLRGRSTWLLRAVTVHSRSSYAGGEAIVLPLYVPTERVYLNWSRYLTNPGQGQTFDLPTETTSERVGRELAAAVGRDGLPHLDELGNLEGFAGRLIRDQAHTLSERGYRGAHAEELGYTLILLGYYREAAVQFAAATPPDPETAGEWEYERADRMRLMARLLDANPQDAIDQLSAWAQQSADAIGIERTAP